eukprot:1138991-Pelagomonas_calceolata.AAC.6
MLTAVPRQQGKKKHASQSTCNRSRAVRVNTVCQNSIIKGHAIHARLYFMLSCTVCWAVMHAGLWGMLDCTVCFTHALQPSFKRNSTFDMTQPSPYEPQLCLCSSLEGEQEEMFGDVACFVSGMVLAEGLY